MANHVKLGMAPDKTIEAINEALDAQGLALEGLEDKIDNLPDADTKNTAGGKKSTAKLFPVGTTSSNVENGVTYNNEYFYVIDGVLYARRASTGETKEVTSYRVLNAQDLAEINQKLGDLAGGMEYVGTIGSGSSKIDTDVLTGNGTSSNYWILPTTQYKDGKPIEKGNTLKVKTAGYYGLGNEIVYAQVGDIFIAVLTDNTDPAFPQNMMWTHVPSGDDQGDIYADKNFNVNTEETNLLEDGFLVMTDNDGTNPKRIKGTTIKIIDKFNDYLNDPYNNSKHLASIKAILGMIGARVSEKSMSYVDASEFQIDTSYGNATTHLDDQNNYKLITKTATYNSVMPVAAYDGYDNVMLVGLQKDVVTGRLVVIIHKDYKNELNRILVAPEG